ncbi:hypothetical protein GGI12_001945, partial [Dipsacomyces acuminosporus]
TATPVSGIAPIRRGDFDFDSGFPVVFNFKHEFDLNALHAKLHDNAMFVKDKGARVFSDKIHAHKHKAVVA